jgi:hypothetical protein
MKEETVLVYIKILFRNPRTETEENHKQRFSKKNQYIRRAQVKVGLRLERRYNWDTCFNQQGDYV